MALDLGDGFAIIEGVALIGSWAWLQTRNLSYGDWRRKAALAALVSVSLTVVFDLILTVIMHLVGTEAVGARLYVGFLAAMGTTSLLSLILGLLGRGSPRILALVWSSIMLSQAVLTVAMGLYQE